MGTRRKACRISRAARSQVEFFAAESYPLEVAGFVIGDDHSLQYAAPITRYEVRHGRFITYGLQANIVAEEVFGDSVVAEFHSHPQNHPSISKNDLANMEDNDMEWIVGICPGVRKWRLHNRLYTRQGNRPLIVPIVWN